MHQTALIRKPIEEELNAFTALLRTSLESDNRLLQQVLDHIRCRTGKMMRPILVLLMAKATGTVTDKVLHAATALELLHTASLVHDDVVDESAERRGQPSVNALFDNRLAVLVGDYLLSTALYHAAQTEDVRIIRLVSRLGLQLADGEILQLETVSGDTFSEETYFNIIRKKTGALFETCAEVGALAAGASPEVGEWARGIGEIIGTTFQIKDDIFDFSGDASIGKPTGNDMREGKLTLPVIHALLTAGDKEADTLALRVKHGTATDGEIARLVEFTKAHGGIAYAQEVMQKQVSRAHALLARCKEADVRTALTAYVDYVVEREK